MQMVLIPSHPAGVVSRCACAASRCFSRNRPKQRPQSTAGYGKLIDASHHNS